MADDQLTPAFQQLSETNRGPLVIVATFIFLAISCLAVFTKAWTRLGATARLAWTDWTILTSLICFVGQAIALTIAVNHGVGRHAADLTDLQIDIASKALYAAYILLPIVVGGAKASVCLLILSVQPFPGPARTSCKIFLCVVAAWVVASIFAVAFQCNVPNTWAILAPDTAHTCDHQHATEIALGSINVLTDVAVVILAFFMIKTVQIPFEKKAVVVLLFALRLATPPFAILALVTSQTFFASDMPDRTWNAVPPLIYLQVMVGLSIITACIPSIKRFFDMVHSGVSNVPVSTAEQYELSQSRSGSVVTLGKKFRETFGSVTSKSKSRAQSEMVASLTQSASRYSCHIEGGNHAADSMKRLASVEGIRQQTEYEVEYEENPDHLERGVTYNSTTNVK